MVNKDICRRCYRSRIRMTSPAMTAMAMDKFEKEWSDGLVWCQANKTTLLQRVAEEPPPDCLYIAEQAVS